MNKTIKLKLMDKIHYKSPEGELIVLMILNTINGKGSRIIQGVK